MTIEEQISVVKNKIDELKARSNLYLKEQEKVTALQAEVEKNKSLYESLLTKVKQIKDILSTIT